MADAVAPRTESSIFSNPQTLQQWTNLLESLFPGAVNTTGTQAVQNSSKADSGIMAMIQNLLGQQAPGGANAANIQALLAPIFQQFKEGAMPQIQGLANAGGGVYNSTTQGLLQNDALARATAQGGAVVVGQQNAINSQLSTLLNILAQSTRATNTATNQSVQKQGQASNAAKAALGTAAAAGLAKALQKAKEQDSLGTGRAQIGQEDPTANQGDTGVSDRSSQAATDYADQAPGEQAGNSADFNFQDYGMDFGGFDYGSLDASGSIGDYSGSDGNWGDFSFLDYGGGGDSFGGFGGGSGDTFDLFAAET